jgi:hypothetical protein
VTIDRYELEANIGVVDCEILVDSELVPVAVVVPSETGIELADFAGDLNASEEAAARFAVEREIAQMQGDASQGKRKIVYMVDIHLLSDGPQRFLYTSATV